MARKKSIVTADVIRAIKDQNIRYFDLKFVDLLGMLQHLTIPVDMVGESLFQEGLSFDGSSVRGFQKISESDMLLLPDANSLFRDPFFDEPTLSCFCNIVDPNGLKPYTRDPRGVARRAEKALRAEGIADVAQIGPELEFFIFDEVSFDQEAQFGYYFLNSSAAFWSTGREGKPTSGHQATRKQAYFAAPPADHYHNLRTKISDVLQDTGIRTQVHHHEVAAAGQCEISFRHGSLLAQADNAIKYKYVVKNVVHRYQKTATFMPKPLLQENGSGMHVNVSLEQGGKNIFHEHGRYGELSETAVFFIGGILKHARALCALCAPTTNSYRRLVPGYEAPMILAYSQRNRSACVRVPLAGNSAATRIEFRTPDPSANPYLAYAAILMAGMDGVLNKIQPPGPVDDDIYELAAKGARLPETPSSLEESLDALAEDNEFLTSRGVFTADLIDNWINYKRENEVDFIRLRPHPGEFSLYFNT